MPFNPAVDDLVEDLGALIADRHALNIRNEGTRATVTRAVHDAGLAVVLTIGHDEDKALVAAARDAIAFGRYVIGALSADAERGRALSSASHLMRERAAQFLLESVSSREGRDRRKRR